MSGDNDGQTLKQTIADETLAEPGAAPGSVFLTFQQYLKLSPDDIYSFATVQTANSDCSKMFLCPYEQD